MFVDIIVKTASESSCRRFARIKAHSREEAVRMAFANRAMYPNIVRVTAQLWRVSLASKNGRLNWMDVRATVVKPVQPGAEAASVK